jgi:hypothetical protein
LEKLIFFFTHSTSFINYNTGLAKNMFFLFKTKHTVFFNFKQFFLFKTCFKPILNTNKTELNRLKSLLSCCTFTLDHWACALRSYINIEMQTAKLRKFRFLIIFSCYF